MGAKPTFNAALARICVLASSRAYTEASLSDLHTDTQVLILELPHCIIVAFRGTSSLEDFITDADFFTTRINMNSDERVHLGFYKALKSVEMRLKNRLDEIIARRPGGPIIFTGHSLGGALAILAAFYLKHFFNIGAVYTFGAPDVGNALFAKHYERLMGGATFALGNACDPVTWLPPYRFGFRRVGRFYFLTGVSWIKSGFRLPLAARLFAGCHQVFMNWRHGKLALLANHHVELYKTRVEKLCACDAA